MKKIILYIISCLCLPCVLKAQDVRFPLPEVPLVLSKPADKANYVALHYWDHFDFKDNSLIEKPEITEQGWVEFISLVSQVTERKEAFAAFAQHMTENPKMQAYFLELSEHYLFDNFSPVYDEELYLLLVDEMLKQSSLSLVQRERLRYQRRRILKNRVNQPVTDFSFMQRNGKRMNLKVVKAEYILLYLNDPEILASLNADMNKNMLGGIEYGKNGELEGNGLVSADEFRALSSELERTVTRIAEEMRSGAAHAVPNSAAGKSPCEYCSVKAVCRVGNR